MPKSVVLGLSLLALLAAGCNGGVDQQRKIQIRDNCDLVQKQVDAADTRNADFQARLENMRLVLSDMNAELDRNQPNVEAAGAAVTEIRGLMFGNDRTEGLWAVSHRSRAPWLLGLVGVILAAGIGWRLRDRGREREMTAEVNRVIDRLDHEAKTSAPTPPPESAATAEPASEPAPVKPAPAPAPEPEPEPPAETKAPEPVAAPPEPVKEPEPEPEPPKPAAKPAPKPEPKPTAEPKAAAKPAKKAAAKPAAKAAEAKTKPAKKAVKKTAEKKTATKKAATKKTEKAPSRAKTVRRTPAKKCKVAGCQNKHRSKGLCNKHYQQWRKGILTEEVED